MDVGAREQIVHDEIETCPYLDGKRARMPLRWQLGEVRGLALDQSLAAGDRRVGRMLYRTSCPECHACEPIRINVEHFRRSRSQRRAARRNQDVRVLIGPASFTQEKLDLYNRHKFERGLAQKETAMTRRGYDGWFLQSCTRTAEMRYMLGERLIGVGIVDVGLMDTSSVYFYFDPDESRRSLGTWSTLVEIEYLRRRGGRFHYLGLYVGDCRHLSYKARFLPHERLVDGAWRRFDGTASSG
ncbi:MAG: arginyltransferase [Oligoflexia bacterium]|nr:arginyltransferase [Oligoflexia bacterium]